MNNKIIVIDTNILFDVLSYFKANKSNISKNKLKKIMKVQQLFKIHGKSILIPDIVINEFSARFFNIMEIDKEMKEKVLLTETDYIQWINIQNSAWGQILYFILSNGVGQISLEDFKNYGYNVFNLAIEITRFKLPLELIEKIVNLSSNDPYAETSSGKLFDGLDSFILSYILIMAIENPEKEIVFITNDNYFKIGANYFIENELQIMDDFKYPNNLLIKGV